VLRFCQISQAQACLPDRCTGTDSSGDGSQVGHCRLKIFHDDPHHAAGYQGIGLAERHLARAGRHGIEPGKSFSTTLTVRERHGEGAERVLSAHVVGASRGDGALAPGHCFAEPSRDQAAGQQSGGSLRAGQRFERRVMGLPGITQQGFRAGRPGCQQIEMAEYRAPPGPVASVGGARSQCLGLGYVTAAKQHLDRVENQAAGVGGPRAQRRSLRQPCRCLRHPVPPGNIGFSGARSLFEIRSQIRGECRAAASRGSDPVSKRVIGPGQDCRLLMQQAAPDRPDLVVDHMVRQRVGEQDPAACSGGLLRSQANRDQLT
jgi:hypothetical protein